MSSGRLFRKKKLQQNILILPIAALALCLCGCEMAQQMQEMFPEEEETPSVTTLTAAADGSISETIVDLFDKSYYDETELKDLVDQTVAEYNASSKTSAVTVDDFQTEEGRVMLKMTYLDAAAYAGYNHVPFFNGSILDAQMEGFLFLNDFRKVAKSEAEPATISNAEPLSHKEYQVLITDLSHAVKVPGKIAYISANTNLADKELVIPAAVEESPEEGLILPSSAVYVQKKENTQLSDDEIEKTYMYVIYDQ